MSCLFTLSNFIFLGFATSKSLIFLFSVCVCSDCIGEFIGVQEVTRIIMNEINKRNFGIYLIATPIGNLGDISKRAIDVLKDCDLVICENPKHSLRILNKFGIKKKLISLHDYNENSIIKLLSEKLDKNMIALVSDAGSPLISDPGFKFIQHCINNKVYVTSIPGPTSIIPALQLSGMPINEFYFAGFFPKSIKNMNMFIKSINEIDKTVVFFVSTHKIKRCLEVLNKEVKDRFVSVSKELTKINEKTYRGSIDEIINEITEHEENFKGEFVVVVGSKPKKKKESYNLSEFNDVIMKLLQKFSLTEVVEIVHNLTGISKNKVYKWVLIIKKS